MGKVILIVDNDPKSLKLAQDLLQIEGYTTLEATDGKQVVEIAKAKKPDLVLMDLHLPVIDGFEATKILKANAVTKHIPIVVLTSYAMKGDEEKIKGAGGDEYMSKPIDTREFRKKIRQYLEG
jgi:two-component system cell cycle response regulator DivK